jgi:hypothetical protein
MTLLLSRFDLEKKLKKAEKGKIRFDKRRMN